MVHYDEAPVYSYSPSHQRVLRRRGTRLAQKYLVEKVKRAEFKINLLGCISGTGRVCIAMTTVNTNERVYKEIIDDVIAPFIEGEPDPDSVQFI